MYDFLTNNAGYVVLIIALVCWLGIFIYLYRMDNRIAKLEQTMKK
jgi:CcmD family protein